MDWKEYLTESINDKNILKCVLLSGGPGSGKTFVSLKMFTNLAKFINPDTILELTAKKLNIPLKIVSKEEDPELNKIQNSLRARAVVKNTKVKNLYTNSMLPIVIDVTGSHVNDMVKIKDKMESLGYDVSLVFVNTSKEIALSRNLSRDRILKPELVATLWDKVQENVPKFKSIFGQNFYEIKNDEIMDNKMIVQLQKLGDKIFNKPLKNEKGKKIVDYLKKTNGKTLEDIPDTFWK